MSFLRQINEFLSDTRELSVELLNAKIKKLDWSAEPVTDQSLAHAILGYMQTAVLKDMQASFIEARDRAVQLKEKHGWLFAPTSSTEKEEEEVKLQPVIVPKQPKRTKQQLAAELFAMLDDKSKTNVIKNFVTQLGLTEAGAQTYFYACGGVSDNVASSKLTKKQQAQQLYDASPDKARDVIVELFVTQLQLTKSGAQTYYYMCGGAPIRRKGSVDNEA